MRYTEETAKTSPNDDFIPPFDLIYNYIFAIQKYNTTMFTTGILTTHLPYLAFVFFYAWFFIFGVQKANSSELLSKEITFQSENLFIQQTPHFTQEQNFHYYDTSIALNTFINKNILIEKRIKHNYISVRSDNPDFSFSILNRPPPAT